MSSSTVIKINGKTYKIKNGSFSVDPQQVANLVDAKMRELSGARGSTSTQDLAVLTALNIAHDLLEVRRKMKDLETSSETGLDRLIEFMEKEVENIKS